MRFLLVLAVLGGYGLFSSFQEYKIMGVARDTATSVKVEDLFQDGLGDNAHLQLNSFYLGIGAYVAEENENGTYNKVWVPVFEKGGAYHHKVLASEGGNLPKIDKINMIFYSESLSNEDELVALFDAQLEHDAPVNGIITNAIETLDGTELNILKESYPQADFSNVLIFHHNREPPTYTRVAMFGGGGLLSLLLCGLLGIRQLRP